VSVRSIPHVVIDRLQKRTMDEHGGRRPQR